MHSASSSSCISLNGSSYTHAAIGGELLPACVDHRPRASNATAPAAAVISWLSRSSRTDIRRFIEYYILLGAERFAILDNLCNASAVSPHSTPDFGCAANSTLGGSWRQS